MTMTERQRARIALLAGIALVIAAAALGLVMK